MRLEKIEADGCLVALLLLKLLLPLGDCWPNFIPGLLSKVREIIIAGGRQVILVGEVFKQ